jgi:hypothetical protein
MLGKGQLGICSSQNDRKATFLAHTILLELQNRIQMSQIVLGGPYVLGPGLLAPQR